MALLLVLSPSKTQQQGERTGYHTLPQFAEHASQLASRLKTCSVAELAQLMGISEKLALRTHQQFATFSSSLFPDNCREAMLTFRGDVFSEMAPDSYDIDTFNFAQKHLRIFSGLYGLLRPLDLIQPYRLEMGGRFRTKDGHSLYDFWKQPVTKAVNEALAPLEDGFLMNLASEEYFKVLDKSRLTRPIIQVHFRQKKNSQTRTIAIHAKKARGALAEFIIRNRIENPAHLHSFSWGNYRFRQQQNTVSELIFQSSL